MNIRLAFGLLVLLMLASTILLLAFIAIPKGNENTFVQLVGTLSTLAGLVIGYYFGDSEASRRRTELMDQDAASGKAGDPVHIQAEETK